MPLDFKEKKEKFAPASSDNPSTPQPSDGSPEPLPATPVDTEGALNVPQAPVWLFGDGPGMKERPMGKGYRDRRFHDGPFGHFFALNSATARAITPAGSSPASPREHFRQTVSSPDTLFAETTELDKERILTTDELTNEAVRRSNYEFVLRNIDGIKTNLARVLLAKIETDQDLSNAFQDMLGQDESYWRNASPDEILGEITGRIRRLHSGHEEEYRMLLSMVEKAERIERERNDYSQARMARLQEAFAERVRDSEAEFYGISRRQLEESPGPNTPRVGKRRKSGPKGVPPPHSPAGFLKIA